MDIKTFLFNGKSVIYYSETRLSELSKVTDLNKTIIITDENVMLYHGSKISQWKKIIVPSGEKCKSQAVVDSILSQLIEYKADNETVLVGMGGGAITDLVGYVSNIYLRGVSVGFIPTTWLGVIDASLGGKNAINHAGYKNMVGSYRHPDFIFLDISLLASLPDEEWSNGMAMVIKHACVKDFAMVGKLEKGNIFALKSDVDFLNFLIRRNILLKCRLIRKDSNELNERRLLNFGNTIGKALESVTDIKHGHAVSLGMVAACRLSEEILKFKETYRIVNLLESYSLPVNLNFDPSEILNVMHLDSQKKGDQTSIVLLKKIGQGEVHTINQSNMLHWIKNQSLTYLNV